MLRQIKCLLLLVFFLAVSCSGSNVELPDFTKWSSYSMQKTEFVLNGKRVELKVEIHQKSEDNRESGVIVWNDVNDKPWFLIYEYKIFEPGSHKLYLFEIKNSKWILVKDFSGIPEQEIIEFVLSRYSLDHN